MIILGFFLIKHIQLTLREIARLSIEAQERISLLNQMKIFQDSLPDKPIFFITGNSEYYSVKSLHVPFQQGVGYTLMAWFANSSKIPVALLGTDPPFLWDVYEEGYKTIGTKGFGFFYDYNDLLKFMSENSSISPKQVVAFYYDSNSKMLSSISEKVQENLISHTPFSQK